MAEGGQAGMVETYEIQLFSKYLSLVDPGRQEHTTPRIGTTVRGIVGDPLFVRIGELEKRLRESGLGVAFGSWNIARTYEESEVDNAELFLLNIPLVDFSAEEYGTRYDDTVDCQQEMSRLELSQVRRLGIVSRKLPCGICSKQIGPLRIPLNRLRGGVEVYRLWSREPIVCADFARLIRDGWSTGAALIPVSIVGEEQTSRSKLSRGESTVLESVVARRTAKARRLSKTLSSFLFQLILKSNPLEVSDHSRFGATPFDASAIGYHRCICGQISGLRLISPLHVVGSSWDGSDVCRTAIYVGSRQGLFRPHQLLVVSKRILSAVRKAGITGFQFEIVEMT